MKVIYYILGVILIPVCLALAMLYGLFGLLQLLSETICRMCDEIMDVIDKNITRKL